MRAPEILTSRASEPGPRGVGLFLSLEMKVPAGVQLPAGVGALPQQWKPTQPELSTLQMGGLKRGWGLSSFLQQTPWFPQNWGPVVASATSSALGRPQAGCWALRWMLGPQAFKLLRLRSGVLS